MKIRIIGGPGSGKTTIAKKISQDFCISYVDLDELYWDNKKGYGHHKPKEQRDKELANILKEKSWVIEGVYYGGWCQKTIDKADLYLYIETSITIAYYRMIKRFLKRKLKLEQGKKETFKSFWGLLRWTMRYEKQKRPQILQERPKLVKTYEECIKEIDNHFNMW